MALNIGINAGCCRSDEFRCWAQIVNGSLSAKIQGIDRNKLAGEVVRFVVGLKWSSTCA
jgi:hypothetical protein